ncbi:MAG: Tfp pilus assembly protein FimT/FimU [Leptolyngbyaceae cyanobacterium]
MKFLQCRRLARGDKNGKTAGFTLLEILIVLVIVGIFGAIATPTWAKFLAGRRVTLTRDELHQGIQQAQSAAIAQRTSWRFSLRQRGDRWEWAIHPNTQDWRDVDGWQALDMNIMLEQLDTTLAKKQGVYYVRFGHLGEVKYRLSTVTVADKHDLTNARCVVISTLLGATRKGEEQLYPNPNGRYCY